MKNVITYDFNKHQGDIRGFLKYQIEISLALGWKPEDIIIVTNANIKFKNVESIYFKCKRVKWSRFIYRTYALLYIFKELKISDVIWYHDWDAFQLEKFSYSFPANKDISIYYGQYFKRRKQPNGGSMFIRSSFVDILEEWLEDQLKTKHDATEPSLQKILENKSNRIFCLSDTYNLGNTAFRKRFARAEKPIKVIHFKVTRPIFVKKYLSTPPPQFI